MYSLELLMIDGKIVRNMYSVIKLRGLSPRADYTDRAVAAGRRN